MINYFKTCSLLIIVICYTACSQTKDAEKLDKMTMKVATYINSILKNVKHPSEEITYYLDVFAPNSKYRLTINGFLVEECYGIDDNKQITLKRFHPINSCLNPIGKQKVSFEIFPFDKKVFEFNDNIEISIEKIDQFKKKETIYIFEPPMKSDGETPIQIGLNGYSGSFDFETTLPSYEKQINWYESDNLKDLKGIEEDVLKAYKEVMRLYQEGDLETLLELYKPIFQDEAQLIYATKRKKRKSSYKLNLERLHPFFFKSKPTLSTNYEMKFYADGRLVTLEKKIDSNLIKTQSALSIIYDKDFNNFPNDLYIDLKDLKMFENGIIPKKEMELYLFFYKPKGSKHLKLATDIFREEKLLNPTE